jgi:hypothetical protein
MARGVGPPLAALTLKLETARNRLSHDPEAQELLSDLPSVRGPPSPTSAVRSTPYAHPRSTNSASSLPFSRWRHNIVTRV